MFGKYCVCRADLKYTNNTYFCVNLLVVEWLLLKFIIETSDTKTKIKQLVDSNEKI